VFEPGLPVPDVPNVPPTGSPVPANPRQFWPTSLGGWITAGTVIAAMFGCFCAPILVPLLESPTSRPRSPCKSNLKQIGLALQNYHVTYGSFPPAYVADENGRPMHSWRVLILSYLDHKQLYDEYRFDEPWDGPHNSKLLERAPAVFSCPNDVKKNGRANRWMTSYVAVIGPETAWPVDQPTTIRDITDGTANTIQVVEVGNSGVNWMEPRDRQLSEIVPTLNGTSRNGLASAHTGGAQALFADGSVKFLNDTISADLLRALLTRNGAEIFDASESTGTR
jgi:prepilin-type processing-associated H-X9-DG protein